MSDETAGDGATWKNHKLVEKLRNEDGAELWIAETQHGARVQVTVVPNADKAQLEQRAGLRHPNIPEVHAVEIDDAGTGRFSSELLSGVRLDERIARASREGGMLKAERAARIIESAARALAYAHARGVAHGDVRTSRLYVQQDEVKIEFPVRPPADATPQGDVKALGAAFFKTLCGERPGADPDVRKLRSDVPPTMASLIKHMMAPQPQNRPSMNEVAESLLGMRGSAPQRRPEQSRPIEASVVMRAPRRPFPVKQAAIAGGAVIGLALIALVVALLVRCPSGQHREGGQCMPDVPCPGGTAWFDGQCRSICGDDEVWANGGGRPKPPPAPAAGTASKVDGVPDVVRVFIPGGRAPSGNEVDPFWIGKNEVTVAAFRACGQANACDYTQLSTECAIEAPRDLPNRPMTCVSYAQAAAFCKFAGGRLPTADEYEYVATGAGAGTTYPWGNEAPQKCDRAWYGKARIFGCGLSPKAFAPYEVCSRPSGNTPFEVCDLSGNVWEWLDQKLAGGDRRVGGGSFRVDEQWLSPLKVSDLAPAAREIDVGFRCAWSWP